MIDGRIIKGVGGLYHVAVKEQIYLCSIRGIFRKRNVTPMIGDFVVLEVNGDAGKAVIVEIKERRNKLIRPRVANIDRVMLTFAAADPVIDLALCDMLIILAESAGIEPLIAINKIDLNADFEFFTADYKRIGYKVVAVSTINDAGQHGLSQLSDVLSSGVTALAGPSGVGKSSIINKLLSYNKMETGAVSQKIARGKHTTRHAELIPVGSLGFVIDTPGFTTIDPQGINCENLPELFREFRQFIGLCRFNDCRHINEPGCAVKENVGSLISERRYRHYIDIFGSIERS